MSLIRRLVIDTARRLWSLYAIAAGMLFFLAWISNVSLRRSELLGTFDHLFGWSMASAWFLAASPVMLLEGREIVRLPISRREIWIARWWLAVVVPATAIAIGLGAGALMGHVSAGPERFVLAMVYCCLYAGCYMAVSAAIPLTSFRTPGGWAMVRILIRMMVIPLGGSLLPLWFGKYLPRTFHDLSGPAMGTLVAAAGVTIASYFNNPPIVERPGRSVAKPAKAHAGNRASILDGLCGLNLLIFKEVRKALLLYGILLALVAVAWAGFGSGSLADFFRDTGALIFWGLPPHSSVGFAPTAMFYMSGVSDIGLMGDMRSLRALPLSSTALSTVLSGLNVMTTAMLWVALLATHVLALHAWPTSLRPDLFLVVVGGIALSHMIRIAWPMSGASRVPAGVVMLVPMLIAFQLGYEPQPAWVRAAMILGGSAALVLSWLVNIRTLRRGSRIYKMKPPIVAAISS